MKIDNEITKQDFKKLMAAFSPLEELFAEHIRRVQLPKPVREHRFHLGRDWKFDFAWPDKMIAVELEGGTWSGGRHVRGKGFEEDCRKYNAAVELGWKLFRYTTKMVEDGDAVFQIERILK